MSDLLWVATQFAAACSTAKNMSGNRTQVTTPIDGAVELASQLIELGGGDLGLVRVAAPIAAACIRNKKGRLTAPLEASIIQARRLIKATQ